MRCHWCFLVILILGCGSLLTAQQENDILFQIGNDTVTEKDALDIMFAKKDKKTITVDEFNKMLNFYLTIYDFKARGADTTKAFKRKLEMQTLNILGSIYSTENYKQLMDKCTMSRNTFAIVKDLFVPFDPILLRQIEELKKNENVTFEQVVNKARAYEGTSMSTRIISPTETRWALNNAICNLLESDNRTGIIGPIKDSKGYHYIELIREQENFGRYKTLMIYIPDMEGSGEPKIREAFAKLKSGKSFKLVAKEYSQPYRIDETAVKYFVPSINSNEIILKELEKLTIDGAMSKPFFASGGWYIIKRLSKEAYPLEKNLKEHARYITRKPSFFIEELKQRYQVQEYPYNFMSGRDDILFLVSNEPFYTKDLRQYASEYGYNFTTDTYDKYLHHLLVERYKKDIDTNRYQRLIDDFYFMQVFNPMEMIGRGQNKEKFIEDLRKLVNKYNPVIPKKKYVEDNPVFEN
ncbi:hypothetical protein C7377_1747 [Balneicella halophila]|uniref:Parvulin-like peptidyl-prolyl cis-trans isomerase protein n=2 Tax=Balneicella halophila TaxID=1537566 RepID=A0A7L4UPB4_BALHA|nr:hypothetical protein C7377_1747 [Balneicella halophila]